MWADASLTNAVSVLNTIYLLRPCSRRYDAGTGEGSVICAKSDHATVCNINYVTQLGHQDMFATQQAIVRRRLSQRHHSMKTLICHLSDKYIQQTQTQHGGNCIQF